MQQIDQRLFSRVPVDIEVGIDADDAVNAESCSSLSDGCVSQVQGKAGKTLSDAVDGWQAGVGGDVHLDGAAFDPQQEVQGGLVMDATGEQGADFGQYGPGGDEADGGMRFQPVPHGEVPVVRCVEQGQQRARVDQDGALDRGWPTKWGLCDFLF